MSCKNHQDKQELYQCTNCNNTFCEECVMVRRYTDEFTAYICKECGGKCNSLIQDKNAKKPIKQKIPINKGQPAKVTEQKIAKPVVYKIKTASSSNFWLGLLGSLIYPLMGKGILFVLFAGAFFYGVSELSHISPIAGLIISIPCMTYLIMYLYRIVDSSLQGANRLPPLLNGDYWISAAQPVSFIVLVIFLYLAPATMYLLLTQKFDVIFFILLGLSAFIMPMAMLAVVISKKINSLNPAIVIVAIIKNFFIYLLMYFVIAGLKFSIFYVNDAFLINYRWMGMMGLQLMIAYITFVIMRILGIFGKCYRQKLVFSENVKSHEQVS